MVAGRILIINIIPIKGVHAPVLCFIFITAEKGGVAKAKGGGRKRKIVLPSARADGDGMIMPT